MLMNQASPQGTPTYHTPQATQWSNLSLSSNVRDPVACKLGKRAAPIYLPPQLKPQLRPTPPHKPVFETTVTTPVITTSTATFAISKHHMMKWPPEMLGAVVSFLPLRELWRLRRVSREAFQRAMRARMVEPVSVAEVSELLLALHPRAARLASRADGFWKWVLARKYQCNVMRDAGLRRAVDRWRVRDHIPYEAHHTFRNLYECATRKFPFEALKGAVMQFVERYTIPGNPVLAQPSEKDAMRWMIDPEEVAAYTDDEEDDEDEDDDDDDDEDVPFFGPGVPFLPPAGLFVGGPGPVVEHGVGVGIGPGGAAVEVHGFFWGTPASLR
eukprot:RCo035588